MKINDNYEIIMQIALIVIDPVSGKETVTDVYDSFEDFYIYNTPDDDYRFVYAVIDTTTGEIPERCSEWHLTPEGAMKDYNENIVPHLAEYALIHGINDLISDLTLKRVEAYRNKPDSTCDAYDVAIGRLKEILVDYGKRGEKKC